MRYFKQKRGFLSIIKEDFVKLFSEPFDYLFLFIQFVYFSGLVRQFGTDTFLISNILVSFILCSIKKNITEKSINIIFLTISIFLLLNLISSILFGLNLRLIAGYTGRIILGYLIVLYFKDSFFEKFERLVTILALISLPLFLIQIIYPEFYSIFNNLSNAVLSEKRVGNSEGFITGHKYLFVFLVNGWGSLRNSGFMWEPAAFGAMLTWAALFNAMMHNFKFNPKLYILLITTITTFSLGTYFYFTCLILMLALVNLRSNLPKILIMLAFILLFGAQQNFVLQNLDMMSNKIKNEEQIRQNAISGRAGGKDISRLAAFEIDFAYFLNWPFGYGLGLENDPDMKYLGKSPNGLMMMLVLWGFLGITCLLLSVARLIKYLGKSFYLNLSWFYRTLLVFLFILPLFGNPFYNQPFLFSLLLGVWVLEEKMSEQEPVYQ